MTTVTVNGTSLAYGESGAGVPVVFVHGSLADFRSWSMQKVPFSNRYRVIAYSRRFHYPNPPEGSEAEYSATLHAADLEALVRSLATEPVHLVGSSFGAYVALLLAVRQPSLVRSLVLGEPPLFPWLEELDGGPALLEAFYSEAWEPARVSFLAGDAVAGVRYFLDGVLGPGAFDAMPARAKSGVMANVSEMTVETSASGYFSPLSRQQVRGVRQPVLLLGGEQSPRIFTTVLEELHRVLPQAARLTIPAASHSMHIGNPAVYNEAVLDFLGEN
jgi:non-heme chloroperoxidase